MGTHLEEPFSDQPPSTATTHYVPQPTPTAGPFLLFSLDPPSTGRYALNTPLVPIPSATCRRPFIDATSHLHTKISSTGPSRPSCRWVSQQDWKPLEVWCPIHKELESMSHALFHCRFLVRAFEVVNTAFRSTRPHPFDIVHLLQDDKLASLETPAGLISRSTISTNWSPCCAKKHNSFFRITWVSFSAKWFHTLNFWTSCPRYLPFPEIVPAWFLDFLQRSSQPRPIPPTTGPKPTPTRNPFTNTPPTPPPPVQAARTCHSTETPQTAEGGGATRSVAGPFR